MDVDSSNGCRQVARWRAQRYREVLASSPLSSKAVKRKVYLNHEQLSTECSFKKAWTACLHIIQYSFKRVYRWREAFSKSILVFIGSQSREARMVEEKDFNLRWACRSVILAPKKSKLGCFLRGGMKVKEQTKYRVPTVLLTEYWGFKRLSVWKDNECQTNLWGEKKL